MGFGRIFVPLQIDAQRKIVLAQPLGEAVHLAQALKEQQAGSDEPIGGGFAAGHFSQPGTKHPAQHRPLRIGDKIASRGRRRRRLRVPVADRDQVAMHDVEKQRLFHPGSGQGAPVAFEDRRRGRELQIHLQLGFEVRQLIEQAGFQVRGDPGGELRQHMRRGRRVRRQDRRDVLQAGVRQRRRNRHHAVRAPHSQAAGRSERHRIRVEIAIHRGDRAELFQHAFRHPLNCQRRAFGDEGRHRFAFHPLEAENLLAGQFRNQNRVLRQRLLTNGLQGVEVGALAHRRIRKPHPFPEAGQRRRIDRLPRAFVLDQPQTRFERLERAVGNRVAGQLNHHRPSLVLSAVGAAGQRIPAWLPLQKLSQGVAVRA